MECQSTAGGERQKKRRRTSEILICYSSCGGLRPPPGAAAQYPTIGHMRKDENMQKQLGGNGDAYVQQANVAMRNQIPSPSIKSHG